jgi:hypothetical protein
MFDAIFSIGTIVIEQFVRTSVVEIIRHTVEIIRQHWSTSGNTQDSPEPHTNNQYTNTNSKDVIEDIEVIDVEFVELEKKVKQDGKCSQKDQERKQELEQLRSDKFKEYQKLKLTEITDEQCAEPGNYETSILKSDKTHILQFHMGQVVLEKKCSCGKPMILQSKQRLDGSLYQLNDFFWACTGFYNNQPLQCKGKQRFAAKDVGFLHKSDIFELQVSNQDLSTIFNETSVNRTIISRIKSHVKQKDNDILCPIHHVPMILREKRDHSGVALDMFFLACPHIGCQQIVKLKSPAQLAAYLHRKEGRGIL